MWTRPGHAYTVLIQINVWSGRGFSAAVIHSDGNPINTIDRFSHEIVVKDLPPKKVKNDSFWQSYPPDNKEQNRALNAFDFFKLGYPVIRLVQYCSLVACLAPSLCTACELRPPQNWKTKTSPLERIIVEMHGKLFETDCPTKLRWE